eukprot:scaffold2.g7196.t1
MMAGRLFQKIKTRSPAELVQRAHQAFVRLPYESNHEREAMFGEDEAHASKDNALVITHEACRTDLLSEFVNYVAMVEFESRKDMVAIFGAIVRIDDNGQFPGLEYLLSHPTLLRQLFDNYTDPEVALNCGAMLRDCIRHEAGARLVLNSDIFPDMFDRLELNNFEIASDVFTSFKDLLTRNKPLVAQYLAEHYADFFRAYEKLLKSDNYVTRRQSLKLLGELLLDRSNVKIMMRYVSEVDNLCLMMDLLRDPSRSIQFEAFHVFKVFVANPNKTLPIMTILVNNKRKLLGYLSDFHTDKDDDEQFKDEKAVIIKEIEMLQLPAPVDQA